MPDALSGGGERRKRNEHAYCVHGDVKKYARADGTHRDERTGKDRRVARYRYMLERGYLEGAVIFTDLILDLRAEDEYDKRVEEASVALCNALDRWDADYDEGGNIPWRDVADIIEVWRQARRDRDAARAATGKGEGK